MRPKLQVLKLGLAALLLATSAGLLAAAPPHTGIRGQVLYSYPGFAVEVEPGVWIGDGGFTMPIPGSFTILAAHSNRKVGHFATDADGAFEVSLPPGEYLLLPDTLFGLAPTPASIQVRVNVKRFTEVDVYYQMVPIYLEPPSGWPIVPFSSSP